MATKNAVLNYEQQFYLSGILLSGVTSIDGSYSISENPINIIGKGYTYPVRQGPLVGNFNIDKYYIGQEPLLNYTGDSPISGSINYNNKSFGFNSGYLTDYNITCSIGSIPKSRATIAVYGNIGSGIDSSGRNPHPDIAIPNQGSISLSTPRSPLYKIGSPYPIQVDREFPISQDASFSVDVNDLEVSQIREYLLKPKQQTIEISLANPINESNIETITLKNARLLSQSIDSDSDGMLTIQLNYKSYINKK